MFPHAIKLLLILSLSLMGACAGIQPTTPVPSYSLTRATDEQKFIVTLSPLATPVAINQIHSWRIKLMTALGAPVTRAEFYVGGGMPDHGHGFPTRPSVTSALGDGEYLLEGMKFSMHGRWEIRLAIQTATGSDMVTFNTMIELPTTLKSVPNKE